MNILADKLFLRCYVAEIIYHDAEIRYIIWEHSLIFCVTSSNRLLQFVTLSENIPWLSVLQVLIGSCKSQTCETQNKPIYISVSKVGHIRSIGTIQIRNSGNIIGLIPVWMPELLLC
jgi:hypothetical protein